MSDVSNQELLENIAIIGLSGRFPAANTIGKFWRNLCNGVVSVSFFTNEQLLAAGVTPVKLSNKYFVKAAGVLSDIEFFDAEFFGFTPREAETTDPQHRILLECAWEALEDAGYNVSSYASKIGVFAGAGANTYLLFNLLSNPEIILSAGEFQIMIGNEKDFLPTRISYKLNLKGPSVNVQTACSTSLVATVFACQSLLNYQCDMALAGGVSVRVPQQIGYLYQEGGIGSPDGYCRAFDEGASGTVFSSGAGMVLLKRLTDALADGDHIYAVIKGFAVNNDGFTKIGYTAPGIDGQAEVISEALALAGIDPDTITYIEAHGTATPLGDPIEIAALTEAFRTYTQRRGFCGIGSLKTNLGHLDTAAGIAGLIKTALAIKQGVIPASLHFSQPNPKIDFESSPFYVNKELRNWTTNDFPRRAGVSSFGIGGTNAHVLLEEAPSIESSISLRAQHLILLSALNPEALEAATNNLIDHLNEHTELNLADIAYTTQVGRKAFNCRKVVICKDLTDAVVKLRSADSAKVFINTREFTERNAVFMFPGQGTQYVNMGLDLYHNERVFREQIDICIDMLSPLLNLDLREIIFPQPHFIEKASQQLEETYLAQPALFSIEYALAKMWIEWGVIPQAMIGHSIGEYVAACLAGVFSLPDALKLVCARARLMQQLPRGGMLAVPLSQHELQPMLTATLSLAAVNGPALCVVAGENDAIDQLSYELAQRGLEYRRLHTSHAFHSHMMSSAVAPFADEVKRVSLYPPKIPYLSNLTGRWITVEQATDPNYWANHLRQTVLFAEGLSHLLTNNDKVLLEVGPGRTLCALAKTQIDIHNQQILLSSLPHPNEEIYADESIAITLGRLWVAGVTVDWQAYHNGEKRKRVSLPTYPFQRRRYWIDPPDVQESRITSSQNLTAPETDSTFTITAASIPTTSIP
ncbi:MAG: type I polyketide synthase, partial [Acidobacteriota bacterium]